MMTKNLFEKTDSSSYFDRLVVIISLVNSILQSCTFFSLCLYFGSDFLLVQNFFKIDDATENDVIPLFDQSEGSAQRLPKCAKSISLFLVFRENSSV